MATFNVNNTNDSGAGSLRQAILDANATGGSNTITFSFDGNVSLGSALPALTSTVTFDFASRSISINGGAVDLGNQIATFITNDAIGIAGLTGSGGFVKGGTGLLILTGANTYGGTTTINTGTLTLSNGAAIPNSSAVTIASAGTLQLNGVNASIGSLAGAGAVNLSSNSLTAGADNGDATFSGSITGSGGSISKTGTGTWTLSGSNSFTGNSSISSGTLKLMGGSAIADSVNFNITGSGKLEIGESETIFGVSTGSSGGIILDSGATLTLANAGSVQSIVSGAGSLAKSGSGALTLSGTNTYTGATTVNAGLLIAQGGSALSDSARTTVASGATLDLTNASETVGSIAGAGTIQLGATTLTTGGDDSSSVFSGTFASGTGRLVKTGAGALTLSGTNSYTGTTTVSSGTLDLRGGNAIADASAVTVATGATLAITQSETIGSLTGSGNVTIAAGQTLSIGNNTTSTAFSGAFTGAGGLQKIGASILTLSGTGGFTGPTQIADGELDLASSTILSSSARLTVDAILAVSADATVGSLDGGSSALISFGSGRTLTVGGDGTSTSFGGRFTNAGSLVKVGAGTLTLTSTLSTYSGTTTVSAGKLLVDGTTASSVTTVASGGTLGGHGTVGSVTVQSGGTLAPGNSPGILNTGNITLAAGSTTQIELNGTTLGTQYDQLNVTGTVALNGTLNVSLGYTPTIGQQYMIVSNDGADAVTGTFSGVAEGGTLTAGGWNFRVSYVGGDGNDVVLTATGVPPPPANGTDPTQQPTGSFLRLQAGDGGGILSGTKGNDLFVGGAGVDTVLEQGVQFADARITLNPDGTVQVVSANGTDTLRNVEKIAFADGTLDLTTNGQRALAIETIYHVALGRAPDAAGFAVQLNSGIDVNTLARIFSTTPEFQKWNGVADVDFVRMVYENALHRAPDYGGLLAQLDALAHGMTRAQLVANFALAPESMQVLGQMHPVGVFTNDLVG